jgi:D-alanyl-D-alanine carboxypeptidase
LPSTYAPSDLVIVGEEVIRRGSNYYLRSIIINDLKEMVNAAKSDGIDLSIVSAYRSYSTQQSTYNYWVAYNSGCVSCADRVSARAGHSQHQLGTTLDFSSSEVNDSLGIKFGDTKASAWLKDNAYKYGFVISFPQGYESVTGFSYEPWHYRYIGKVNAQEMKNSGMILEIYLRGKN